MTTLKPITGATQMLAGLAHPVAHVRSPAIMNVAFAERGLDWILAPMHVLPENLEKTVAVLRKTKNYIAITTTIPHKQEIIKLCDELMPNARLCGAANIIKIIDGRLIAEIFDGIGMVAGMAANSVPVADRRALVCGAGGAARAIAFALCAEGAACVHVHNRSEPKAKDLVEAIRKAFPEIDTKAVPPDPEGYDVVINATSLGLKEGDPTPVDMSRVGADTDVSCVVAVRESETITQARARGCRVVPGIEMMRAQVDAITSFLMDR